MALVSSATSKVYSGFSPTSIPGCALWFDAADSNTLTLSGSNVTVWKDKSRNGFDATASGSPVSSSNGIVFNGSAAFTTNYTAIPTVETLFFVGTFTGPFDGFNYGILGPSVTRGRYVSVYRNTSTDHYFVMGGQGVAGNTGVGGVVLNTRFLGVGTINVPTLTCAINGNSQANTTSGGNFLNNGLTNIGTHPGGYNWYGTMNEIIVFSNVLSASQIQQVEGYLQSKWGLQSSFSATHPYKSIPVALRPFTPLDLPDCGLWLDAIDPASVTVSNTSNVTLWKDKSGRGWNFSQTTAGRYPVYTSNALGTRQMLSFTGAATQGAATQVLDNMSFQLSNSNYSIFMVTNRGATAPSYNGYNYALKATPNNDGVLFFGNIPSKDFAVFTGANLDQWNEVSGNSPAISTLNSTRILGMVSSNTTYTPYYDGKSMTSKNGGTFAFTGLRIGDAGDPGPRSGQNWNGFIGEIVIYNQSLSTSARQQLEGYLAWRWGKVSDLPTTHPFKLAPPLVPAFTPLQISGCALWFDAADRSTLTLNGSLVTQWNDKSGNGYVATATTGYAPSYTTTMNGVPVISSAQNKYLLLSNFNQNFSTASCFYVWRATEDITPNNKTPSGYPTYVIIGGETSGYIQVGVLYVNPAQTGGSAQFLSYLWRNGSFMIDATFGGASPATYTPLGSNMLIGNIFTGSSATNAVYQNGSSLTLGNNSTSGFPGLSGITLRIAGSDNGLSFGYNLAEVILYNSALTTTQRQAVEGYLAAKWGLKPNLPASHGFKTITP